MAVRVPVPRRRRKHDPIATINDHSTVGRTSRRNLTDRPSRLVLFLTQSNVIP